MNNVMMMGVAITLGLLGVFLALPAWNLRKKSLRYDAWSQERGQVVSATLQDQSASHPSGKKFVDVIVKYEYHSNGQLHFDSINAGTFPKAEEEAARSCAAKFPAGGNITVFCDPDDPHHSILKKPVLHWRVSFSAGCILITVGILLLLLNLLGL